ncbi:MAG TPA: hypothetical protein VG675_08715 [Bryobacteraceae bacterium]|nr:hypothetical protein [Bryobacteraceae bacterium]
MSAKLKADQRLTAVVTMLRKYGNDDATVDAVISSIPRQEADAISMLFVEPGTSARPVEVPRTGPSLMSGRAGTVVPGLKSNAEVRAQAERKAMRVSYIQWTNRGESPRYMRRQRLSLTVLSQRILPVQQHT